MIVSRETKFETYLGLLLQWSGSLNLSSRGLSTEAGFLAQIRESLAVVPYLPPRLERLIDLGSGQGFPAIPIAIETELAIELIEADRRKAAFLTTAIVALGLKGVVWPTRIEAATPVPAACVTARALAPLTDLLTLAKPMLRKDGCCLFLKGARAVDEITEATRHHSFDYEVITTQAARPNLVKITNLG